MGIKKRPIVLSHEDRATLEEAIRRGEGVQRRLQRAKMILASAEGKTDQEIAESLGCGDRTVSRTRARYLVGGVEAVLQDSTDGIFHGTVTGLYRFTETQKDAIVALAMTPPPTGSERWSFEALANQAVNLGIVPAISRESVRRILKEKTNRPSRHRSKIPRSRKNH